MIDIELHQDSMRRLQEITEDIKEAKQRKDFKDARQLTKEYEEEQKVLALIERTKVA